MSRGGARVWGNAHPAAQLTEKRVIRYRALVRSGKATVGELAAKEGCSHGRISMAVRGETWAHLNDVAPPVPAAQRRTAQKAAPSKAAPAKRTFAKATRKTATPAKATPAKAAPAKAAPAKAAPAKAAPAKVARAKVAAKTIARAKTARR